MWSESTDYPSEVPCRGGRDTLIESIHQDIGIKHGERFDTSDLQDAKVLLDELL
jgi:hypothetical protein